MEVSSIAIDREIGRAASGYAGFTLAIAGHGKNVENRQCACQPQSAKDFLLHEFCSMPPSCASYNNSRLASARIRPPPAIMSLLPSESVRS